MTVRMHRSTDLGATALTGQQGKMGALLLEVLCKGVPAVSPTSITQTGGVATCSMPAHKFITGQTVTVYGANQTEYNGNQVVTVTGPDAFTFPVSAGAASPATGTITVGGQKTIGTPTSITRSGTTVTVVMTAHGLSVGGRAFIMGADQADYNGWQYAATVADANTFTFELATTQTPTTPATGTMLVRYGDAGLGWSLPFTTTNRSVFKQGVSGTRNRYVLAVDEATAASHTYAAGMVMAEGASSVSTLTGLMYTAEGMAYTGMFKSGTADATARKWVIIGDHRTFIILTKPVVPSSNNTDGWLCSYFGDIVSYLPNDNYPALSGPSTRYGSGTFSTLSSYLGSAVSISYCNANYTEYIFTNATSDTAFPMRMSRNHLGASGTLNCTNACSGSSLSGNTNLGRSVYALGVRHATYSFDTYPDPVHGGINLEKLHIQHATGADNTGNPLVRGELRGLWNPGHRRTQVSTWLNNDTFNGAGELAGKAFEVFDLVMPTSSWLVLETSDTWGV